MNPIAANICAFVGVMTVAPFWISAVITLQTIEWIRSGKIR